MRQSYKDLWLLVGQARPALGQLLLALTFSLLSAAALLWYPLLTQQLVDQLSVGGGIGRLGWMLVSILGAGTVLGALASLILARIGHEVSATLRHRLIEKMLLLPVSYFDRSDTGERVSRVVNDCESISELTTTQVVSLINGVLMLTGSVIILLWLDSALTLVLLLTLLLAFAMVGPAVMKMEGVAKSLQERTAHLSGILTHVFSEIRMVKAFAAETRERERSRGVVAGLRTEGYRLSRLTIVLETIIGPAVMGALIVILVYGGMRVGSGEISMGILTAFILYIFNVVGPMSQLGGFVAELQAAKGASTRMTFILREAEEQASAGTLSPAPGKALVFRQTSFRYSDEGEVVLDGLELDIVPGTTTALVGMSGSGKSTILSLVERFYQPTSGAILYDGRPIAEYDLIAWRRSIGFVPQSSPIMPGTVRDNISYGVDRVCSDQEIRAAAENARAWEFIERLPQGLDSPLIEQGMNLSGGQRQRIAIARVFLRDPNLLLLDEATSSLDSETEHEIQLALNGLMAGRTNIVIAHRLSTVRHADTICFLEDGRISGTGNHEELLQTHPMYAQFVKRQFETSPDR